MNQPSKDLEPVRRETAAKMLKIVNVTSYQGKITYLAIAFLYHTRAGFSEIAPLTIGDVYRCDGVKKSVQLGTEARSRTLILNDKAQKLIVTILEVQAAHGLSPIATAPLFRTTMGKAFTVEQLASLFWLYQEAAEFKG